MAMGSRGTERTAAEVAKTRNLNRITRPGRVAQWESARFTRERSVVRNHPCPCRKALLIGGRRDPDELSAAILNAPVRVGDARTERPASDNGRDLSYRSTLMSGSWRERDSFTPPSAIAAKHPSSTISSSSKEACNSA